ncbi:MAG: CPBP family intramembrane metalloprotease, partial [Candidatus Obscuribacterales bacterium]|nr:CPBP family intramembrane metalloprotease [Candidatus Obscuribacterales bacterium]
LPKAEKSSALAGSNLSKPELPKAEKTSALPGSNHPASNLTIQQNVVVADQKDAGKQNKDENANLQDVKASDKTNTENVVYKDDKSKLIENAREGTTNQPELASAVAPFAEQNNPGSVFGGVSPKSSIRLNDGIKIIRDGSVKQAARTDHYFTFEDEKNDYKGGKQRYTVYVSGNKVSEFSSEFHVPESFDRKYAEIRSYNDLLKLISSVLFAIVSAGTVFAFVWALSTGRLRWRLVFFAAIGSFLLEFFDYWNYLPSVLQQYDTSKSLQGFLSQQIISSILSCCQAGLLSAVVVGGIEAVYRTKFPKMPAVENFLSARALSNKTILDSIVAGIFIFGIHLGYVAAFYLVGNSAGIWSPLEVREVSTLSSVVPAYSAFSVGVNASISEELMYRVFCFVLAQMLFKNFWVANFIQAVGWAFMHSDYPQEPAYARGVELTIVGLFYGWIFKRYGVVTGIISHFVYDAFLGVTSLLLSGSPLLAASGLVACSPPFIALAIGLMKRRDGTTIPSDDELKNENYISNLKVEKEEEEEVHLQHRPLGAKFRTALISVCFVSLLVSAFVQVPMIGDWAQIRINKGQAEDIALRYLREHGVSETDWRTSVSLYRNLGEEESQYGFEKEGHNRMRDKMKLAREPVLYWVRLFKEKQQREYAVILSGTGRVLAMRVDEEEEASGGSPSEAAVRDMVEKFLKIQRPELQPVVFDSITKQDKPNRVDYSLTYEVPSLKMGDARFLVNIGTVGNLVSFPQLRWDIPESWTFERNKQTLKDLISWGAMGVLGVVVFAAGIYWVVGLFRSQAIHWRPALIAGVVTALVVLLNEVNGFPAQVAGYETDVPFGSFLTSAFVRTLISAIMYGAGYALIFAIGHAAFRLLFPGVSLLSLYHTVFRPYREHARETRVLWFDGALAAYVGLAGLAALYQVLMWCEARFSPDVLTAQLSFVSDLTGTFTFGFGKLLDALIVGFLFVSIAPSVRGLYLKYIRSFKVYCVVALIFSLILTSTVKYWQSFVLEAVYYFGVLILAYLWVKHCGRNNPIAYFLYGALFTITSAIWGIYQYAPTVFTQDLFILMTAFFLPLLTPFLVGTLGYRKNKMLMNTAEGTSGGDEQT